ncbi:MAG TPA: SGNH/GDSL hydrolase family protein [Euzebya sp.]|nr:SGNH/GDSL hydrolase family protein [Euzebya sp.]
MTYRRFVAIGDSLTQGFGDVYPDGRLRGFADLLAAALRQVDDRAAYANLARPSVRAHEVLSHQVPEAVAFQPDLVTAIAGINDVIALTFPARRVQSHLDAIFAELRAGAPQATIMTAALPDLSHLSTVARMWRGRVAALDRGTREAAARHGVVVVDLQAQAPLTRHELAMDRVHPSPSGHLRFARAFAASLGLPDPDPGYLQQRPRGDQLHRLYRTAVVAPRFLTKRVARRTLIAGQAPKRPELAPLLSPPSGPLSPVDA